MRPDHLSPDKGMLHYISSALSSTASWSQRSDRTIDYETGARSYHDVDCKRTPPPVTLPQPTMSTRRRSFLRTLGSEWSPPTPKLAPVEEAPPDAEHRSPPVRENARRGEGREHPLVHSAKQSLNRQSTGKVVHDDDVTPRTSMLAGAFSIFGSARSSRPRQQASEVEQGDMVYRYDNFSRFGSPVGTARPGDVAYRPKTPSPAGDSSQRWAELAAQRWPERPPAGASPSAGTGMIMV